MRGLIAGSGPYVAVLVLMAITVAVAVPDGRAGTTSAATRLSIDVWPRGRTIVAGHRHYVLACSPAKGTVPNPDRACAALVAMRAPFAAAPPSGACPSLALGPQEAHVTGVVRGARVDAWLNLRGCGIGRWNRVKAIVPEPRLPLSPK